MFDLQQPSSFHISMEREERIAREIRKDAVISDRGRESEIGRESRNWLIPQRHDCERGVN